MVAPTVTELRFRFEVWMAFEGTGQARERSFADFTHRFRKTASRTVVGEIKPQLRKC